MRGYALLALPVVLVFSAACDGLTRPADPLETDPDVVTVGISLIAGEEVARMLAAHPHRPRTGSPPQMEAVLKGPGWMASFSETVPLESCTLAGPDMWPGPTTCLQAALPEPIRSRVRYDIAGTAPPGRFTGTVVVPVAAELMEPGDTLVLPAPSAGSRVEVAVRCRVESDVGTVRAEVPEASETSGDGTEVQVGLGLLGIIPATLEGAGADTLSVRYRGRPMRFSLRLLALGWNYTNFVAHTSSFPLPEPWPNFGIEGESVYGYFAAAAPSRVAEIRVR